MKKALIPIGSHERIAFPAQGLFDVPAKVDTGADYSSVWASDIQESEGVLRFCLFGPGSKYYTGQPVEATKFGITTVKNSFGVSEERYKVRLPMVMGGRRIGVEFRLADRSRNRYPVLIGKKTLARRFVVDVSANNLVSDERPRRVLILNSRPTKYVEQFVGHMNDVTPGLAAEFRTYDDFLIRIDDRGIDVRGIDTDRPLSRYDLIFFKTYFEKAEFAAAIAEYAQLVGVNFLDSEVATYHAKTKLTQYARLSRLGLPVPKTLVVTHVRLAEQFERFAGELGLPFILKDASANKGNANYLIKSADEFARVAREAADAKACYVAQQYIENDGDYRIVVLDKDAELVIERRRGSADTHMNNTSKGGSARRVPLADVPSDVLALAVRAALALGREVAGVDLVQDKYTGNWYVLEVNNGPQLASGAYLEEKAAITGKFLKGAAGK